MGYYVRSLKDKKQRPQWKIQFISSRQKDQRADSQAESPKRTWDLSKDRWRPLGFQPSMTVEDARVRAKQLNSQILLKQQEVRIKKFEEKQYQFKLHNDALLPDEFVAEFELKFVQAKKFLLPHQRKIRNQQRYKLWRSAQRMIVAVGHEPTDWLYFPDKFYEYFCTKQYSLGYALAVLSMANLWGRYISRKLGQPFYPVQGPRGFERQRVLDSYFEKKSNCRKPSMPITPAHLEIMKPRMKVKGFNWLYISVWFGLRPKEIDQLQDNSLWKIEVIPGGRTILWIYQTKIIALPPDDRWKPIPILFDEQRFALKIVSDHNFKRPIVRAIHNYIGKGHDLYGGRKGFVDLMLSRNQSLENISIWMGHSTLDRTWRSYKNKKIFQSC